MLSGCASSDGKKLVVFCNPKIYISHDEGISWNETPDKSFFQNIDGTIQLSCSDTAEVVAVVSQNGYVWVSKDFGQSWNITSAPVKGYISIAMSSNGSTIGVNDYWGDRDTGGVFISKDFGVTFPMSSDVETYSRHAKLLISSDGLTILSFVYWNGIMVSVDGGVTFKSISGYSGGNYGSIDATVSSSDCSVVYFTSGGTSNVFRSMDTGLNWSTPPTNIGARDWQVLVSSSSGLKVAGFVRNEGVYVSGDYGDSWVKDLDLPLNTGQLLLASDDFRVVFAFTDGSIYRRKYF